MQRTVCSAFPLGLGFLRNGMIRPKSQESPQILIETNAFSKEPVLGALTVLF